MTETQIPHEGPQEPRTDPNTPAPMSQVPPTGEEALREALAEAFRLGHYEVLGLPDRNVTPWSEVDAGTRHLWLDRARVLLPLVVRYGDQRAEQALREAAERVEAVRPSIPPSDDPRRERNLAAQLAYSHAARLVRRADAICEARA